MRWSRHLLILLMLLGLAACALCVVAAGPVWALLWSPWFVGCFILRRGRVVGGVLLLLSSAALTATIWSTAMRHGNELILGVVFASVVAALGGLTALALLRHCLRVDRRATLALVLVAAGSGVAGSVVFTSIPKVPACVHGPFDIGRLTFAWAWINGGYTLWDIVDGKEISWRSGGCHEYPIDGNGAVRSWAIDADRVEDYRVRGRLELGVRGQLQNHKRIGRWESWHINGKRAASGSYRDDEPVGPWIFHHDNGRVREKGSFKVGQREGTWRCWWPNGQLLSMGRYCRGMPCGKWRYWDQNGRQQTSEPSGYCPAYIPTHTLF